MNIIDISKDIMSAKVYDGDPEPRREVLSQIENGDEYNLSALFTCVHTGTHCDSPAHYIDKGKETEQIPLSSYIGKCRVIEVPKGLISKEYVSDFFPKNCERILLKSDSSCYFDSQSAKEAASLQLKLIGIDSISIGNEHDEKNPHIEFLKRDTVILENLNLKDVSEGEYFLFSAPIKISGFEGAPVRAVLIKE